MTQLEDTSIVSDELNWLEAFIDLRIKNYFQTEEGLSTPESLTIPTPKETSTYGQVLSEHSLTPQDRLIIALALAPVLKPAILDTFFIKNKNIDRGFSEFGGINGTHHGGFLPTVETALFILCGEDLQLRLQTMHSFQDQHPLFSKGILSKGESPANEPSNTAALIPHPHFLSLILNKQRSYPQMSSDFPAKRINTSLEWSELILDEKVMQRIEEIKTWLKNQETLLSQWGLAKKLKKGFRCLFYGSSGTGKTLTATLLGKSTNMPVYRVDLSMIVSKYIGETEKNLNKVFDMAESQNWILFFDEADALFGSRVETSTSNDRHANQQISFLLQRIEDFDGLVILASNLKGNIDEAFSRRFQSMIHFPPPDKEERLLLWQSYFNGQLPVDPNLDLKEIADNYEVTGGNIVNVLRYSAIKAVARTPQQVQQEDVIEGLRREFKHMGKTI